jgi:hypothetical protein
MRLIIQHKLKQSHHQNLSQNHNIQKAQLFAALFYFFKRGWDKSSLAEVKNEPLIKIFD